jgi:hypothetical protein
MTLALAALCCILSIALANSAMAAPINYSDTKTFSFTSNVPGAVPVLVGKQFTHAFNRERTIAENTAGQPATFNAFSPENVFYSEPPGFVKLNIFNPFSGPSSKPVNLLTTSPLPLGVTTQTSTAGDASATLNVTALAAPTATGTVTVSGTAPADAANKTGYAFSYGSVSASVGGTRLKGTATVMSTGLTLQSTVIQAFRQGPGVKDPLNFFVTDMSNNILFQLYLNTADVDGGASLNWGSSGLLQVTSGLPKQDAFFEVDVTPLSGAASHLLLQTINGIVAAETATGLFSSLSLPGLGTTGDFSLTVPDDFSFDYDLSAFGDTPVNAMAQWDTAGYSETPEPATLTLVATGLGLGWLVRKRRLS